MDLKKKHRQHEMEKDDLKKKHNQEKKKFDNQYQEERVKLALRHSRERDNLDNIKKSGTIQMNKQHEKEFEDLLRKQANEIIGHTIMPKHIMQLVFEHTEKDMCSVCRASMGILQSMLQCGHVFHSECISPVLKNNNPSCPLCRIPIEESKVHKREPCKTKVLSTLSSSSSSGPSVESNSSPLKRARGVFCEYDDECVYEVDGCIDGDADVQMLKPPWKKGKL